MRQKLEYLVGIHLESLTHTRELKQLKAGYLLHEILRHFYEKIATRLHPDRNLWIYSAHDTTMAILLNALNVFDVIELNFHFAEFLVILFYKFSESSSTVRIEPTI